MGLPNNDSFYTLVPELGDLVTFVSSVLGTVTGRIIYRDGSLIRIRPSSSSSTAVDFPLDPTTGLFQDTLDVKEIMIHTKRKDPHFSKQLSVVPGEILEFFDNAGKPVAAPGTVFEIFADEQYDAIKLEDGTVLDFGFLGPKLPLSVLRARAAPEMVTPPENESTSEPETAEETTDEPVPAFDMDLMPAALVEEIPTEERTYSDSIQREDMFLSLLVEESPKKQKDPKVMQYLYRHTDLLLALKNSVVVRDDSGAVVPNAERSYTASTLHEVMARQTNGTPLSAIVPVAAIRKVIYGDIDEDTISQDVEWRSDVASLMNTVEHGTLYLNGGDRGTEFIQYMDSILDTTRAYTSSKEGSAVIMVDQDVFRSQMPPIDVEGLEKLPNRKRTSFGKPKAIKLTPDYIGSISDRTVRLLSASRIYNEKKRTTYTVAPADTAEVYGHVLLSPKIATYRSPIRSCVLLWDILASERSPSTTFYKAFSSDIDSHTMFDVEDDVNLVDTFVSRLPPVTSFMNSSAIEVLDSLGLRTLELTPELMNAFADVMVKAQTRWQNKHKSLETSAKKALAIERKPAIMPIAMEGSPLLSTETLNAPQLDTAVKTIREKETLLANYDLVIANDLLKGSNNTLGAVWYAIVSGAAPEAVAEVDRVYVAESQRLYRNEHTKRSIAAEFTAVPDINPCEHVSALEKLRGVRDDSIRMKLFEDFIKMYQAGQEGNYMLCGVCGLDLVCKHEVLLLNEYLNPGRGAALHKALLLEYAGPVFEGSYICKTCGQKIMDIEYDTHLEFDDEGRPLVGRTVITEEEPDDFAVAIRGEADAEIPFKGTDRTLYFNQRTLFELCGMVLGLDTYTRTVAACKLYIEKYTKTPEAHEELQRKLKDARFKTDYKTYFGNQLVGTIAALTVMELQTSIANIPIAAQGCVLSRDGFPVDGYDVKTAGTGAVHYVACALAQIKRDDTPWNTVSWSPESNMEKRINEAEKVIVQMLQTLLAIPLSATIQRPLIEGVTEPYRLALEVAKERKMALAAGTTMQALASSADTLPPSWRPLPRIITESTLDTEPIGNAKRFQSNLLQKDITQTGPTVLTRIRQLNQTIMASFYEQASSTGVLNPNSACSESVCCFMRLADAAKVSLGTDSLNLNENITEEIHVVGDALTTVNQRDPAASANGTHIYVPWSAPLTTSILPEADASMYFTLFLKSCYRGRAYGLPHEFGLNYECRNCGFLYPKELIFMTAANITNVNPSKLAKNESERTKIALAAFAAQNVEINEMTFKRLESEIRQRKMVQAVISPDPIHFLDRLHMLGDSLGVLLPEAADDWASLVNAMDDIIKNNLVELRRLSRLADFSRRLEERLKTMKTVLIDGKSRKERNVLAALDAFAKITENSNSGANIRNLRSMFVVGGTQLAYEYFTNSPKVNLIAWFPTINRNHKELLLDIWKKSTTLISSNIMALKEFDEQTQQLIERALNRFTSWFGTWLNIWSDEFRPDTGFTSSEYVRVLQWSAISGMLSLASSTGPLYADGLSLESKQTASSFLCDWLVSVLTEAGAMVNKYQLSDKQIRDRVNARIEKEKQMFIDKLDAKELELRKLELMKKKLKIGDWAVGTTKKLFSYDPEMFEFERAQRADMGVPDFDDNVTAPQEVEESAAEEAGFYQFGIEQIGMAEGTLHRAAQDEDEETAIEGAGRIHIAC